MRSAWLVVSLLLAACGSAELVDDVDEPELPVDDSKADGTAVAMGTYRLAEGQLAAGTNGPLQELVLLRTGRLHTDAYDGTYKLGATMLRLYDVHGGLRGRYGYAPSEHGAERHLTLTDLTRGSTVELIRSEPGWCAYYDDCEPQNLSRADCPGRWKCAGPGGTPTRSCTYVCADYPLPAWDGSVGANDCATAWQHGLSPCDTTPDHYVVLHKSAHNLALCHRGQLVQSYRIGLGLPGDKQWEGDRRTPEGVFYVGQRLPVNEFRRGLVLSYPTVADADRARAAGRISSAEHGAIVSAQQRCALPPQRTALGGMVEIHGHGNGLDWTYGCAALDDLALDEVYASLQTGDTIVVLP